MSTENPSTEQPSTEQPLTAPEDIELGLHPTEKLPDYSDHLVAATEKEPVVAAPPSYAAVMTPLSIASSASFRSVYSAAIQNRTNNGTGTEKTLCIVVTILVAKAVLSLGFPVWLTLKFFEYQDASYTCKYDLPLWGLLVAAGSFSVFFLDNFASCIWPKPENSGPKDTGHQPKLITITQKLLQTFQTAWFVVGNVWVYNSDDVVCDADVFGFYFWYLTIAWIVLATMFCCICCFAVIQGASK